MTSDSQLVCASSHTGTGLLSPGPKQVQPAGKDSVDSPSLNNAVLLKAKPLIRKMAILITQVGKFKKIIN